MTLLTLLVELGVAFALGVLAGTLMTVHYGAAYRLKDRPPTWKEIPPTWLFGPPLIQPTQPDAKTLAYLEGVRRRKGRAIR
jgi:hypothetical protein